VRVGEKKSIGGTYAFAFSLGLRRVWVVEIKLDLDRTVHVYVVISGNTARVQVRIFV
jgi:hypothetical protein